jgi:hypothetical protein
MLNGVTWPRDPGETIAAAWCRAADEQQRAARAAAVAARHGVQAERGPAAMRELHLNLARLHRAMESRHRAAVTVHTIYAQRLERWRDQRPGDAPPPFMSAVAEASGSGSALIALRDGQEAEALVATSDQTAETAHDLESTFGEGPTRDAAAEGRLISVQDAALVERWPLYGPVMRGLGVRSIVAAPLRASRQCFGALAVFHRRRSSAHPQEPLLDDVANALTYTVLLTDQLPLLADADSQSAVNNAAGMVSVQCSCSTDDALALIRACAFAQGERIATVATRVTTGELTLG